jgi:hypothetical protein
MSGDIAIFQLKDGSRFYVDGIKRLLRDESDPKNIIRLEHTEDVGTGYLFLYDRKIRNIAGASAIKDINKFLVIQVPPLTRMNPMKMAELYGVDLNDVVGKTDKQFFKNLPDIRQAQKMMILLHDQDLITARIAGELPIAKVGDRDYVVKLKEKTLYSVQNPDKRIPYTGLIYSVNYGGYTCPYNVKTDSAGIEMLKDSNVEDLRVLVIPHELKLDPVGVAREFGFADTDLLHRFPIQKHLEVKIVPVPELMLKIFIKNGWIKEKRPQKRKGRGLS